MVVYTVITGGYDTLKPVGKRNESWRYVCLTNNDQMYRNGWDVVNINQLKPPEGLSPVLLQRWAKITGAPKFFKCLTIYLDGSHEIIQDVTELFEYDFDIKMKLHPGRACYKDEANACIRLGKADRLAIIAQVSDYEKRGLAPKSGMYETGILIRAWNERVEEFDYKWWAEVASKTHRDQISIMWALSQSNLKLTEFTNEDFKKYIKLHQHNG